MRTELLTMLRETKDYVSGQKICERISFYSIPGAQAKIPQKNFNGFTFYI